MIIRARDIFAQKILKLEIEDQYIHGGLEEILNKENIYCAPGFMDLQVNGYMGVDFNDDSLTVEQVRDAVLEMLRDGVTRCLPTLITNDPDLTEKNLGIINNACASDPLISDCIPGIHLEGPFISAKDGARGAHSKAWVRKPDVNLLDTWWKASGNRISLITISPEYKESIPFIKACMHKGIKVATGHTSAGIEEIREAVRAGISLSTHLGNAMSKEIHRHRNILFEQIANDSLYASIIADGHHLSDSLLKIILRSKPGKSFLVTDATKFTGMPAGIYHTGVWGKIELSEDHRLTIFGDPEYLAGSASRMIDNVNYLTKQLNISFTEAWKLASIIPIAYLYDSKHNTDRNREYVLFTITKGKAQIVLTRFGKTIHSRL